MRASILKQFLTRKMSDVKADLPFEKDDLYRDLKNIYYGDLFFNSPKTELDRLKSKKNLLKL